MRRTFLKNRSVRRRCRGEQQEKERVEARGGVRSKGEQRRCVEEVSRRLLLGTALGSEGTSQCYYC